MELAEQRHNNLDGTDGAIIWVGPKCFKGWSISVCNITFLITHCFYHVIMVLLTFVESFTAATDPVAFWPFLKNLWQMPVGFAQGLANQFLLSYRLRREDIAGMVATLGLGMHHGETPIAIPVPFGFTVCSMPFR